MNTEDEAPKARALNLSNALLADLANRFTERLIYYVGLAHMREVARRNAQIGLDSGICHSHDFCDANEMMVEAFKDVTGCEPVTNGDDPDSEKHRRLWNDAWDEAKRHHFNRVGLALHATGFRLEHQGGGLMNWRKPIGAELAQHLEGLE